MQLGFHPAPAHFQHVMHEALDGHVLGVPRPRHATYIDNVTVPGRGWVDTFRDSMYAMARLAAKGLPLAADKCHFIDDTQLVLGLEVLGATGEYRVGNKALKVLLGGGLPRT